MLDSLLNRYGQRVLYGFAGLSTVVLYLNAILAVGAGWWPLVAFGLWVVAPITSAGIRWLLEPEFDTPVYDPTRMSWSYAVGYPVLMFFALWFAGRGWQSVVMTNGQVAGMTVAAAAMGLVVTVMFRRYSVARFTEAGWRSAVLSPTKVWHDFVIVPVTAAVMAWLLVPQLVLGGSADTVIAAVMLVVFAGLMLLDHFADLDVTDQYPAWDWNRFEEAWASSRV